MKIIYVGNFTQSHCTEVHIAATLEDMGHQVTRVQEDRSNRDNLIRLARGHDLFMFTRTWSNCVTLDHLRRLKNMGIPTVSYHLDLYVGLKRQEGLDRDPFWRTEYVFSPDGDPASQAFFESKGIKHYYLKPGVFKQECIELQKNSDPNLQGEVIFVGGGAEYGHPEWPYRHQLVKWLEEAYGAKYKKYGHPERTVRNMELNQLYANAKIVIGDSLCLNFTHPYYWSDRVYETIGRGGFIIHPYIKGLEEEFTDGENIVFYQYGNFDELRAKIDFYLGNESERKRIQTNGFNFVRENATYHNRLQQVLDTVFNNENQKVVDTLNEIDEIIAEVEGVKINIGAGTDIQEGYVNVDMVELPGIDVVHNLMNYPWPFEDSSANEIRAIDVLEHLPPYIGEEHGVIKFINECWRILKPGGELYIQTPGWKAEFLWIDPTHVRGFDIQSMDFFDPEKPFGKSTGFYSPHKFSVRAEELPNHNLRFWMKKI